MATPPSTSPKDDIRITVHHNWTQKPVVRLTHRPTGTLVIVYSDTPNSADASRLAGLAELERLLRVRDQLLRRGLTDHYRLRTKETMPGWHPKSSRCAGATFSCWWCGIYDPALAAALDVPANRTGLSLFNQLMREDVRSRQDLLQRFPDPAALLEIHMFGSAKLIYLRQALDLPVEPGTTVKAGITRLDQARSDAPRSGTTTSHATTDLGLHQLRYLTRHLSPRVRLAAGLPIVLDEPDDSGLDQHWRRRVDQAAQHLDNRALRHVSAGTRIAALDLTMRTLTILRRADIRTVGELADTNLTALGNLNPRGRKEISDVLEIYIARSNTPT